MPAKSKKQRRAMAIAEHHPEELYKQNKAMLGMTKNQLSEFASTPEKGLPKKKVSAQQRFERKRMRQGAKRW